AVHEAERRIGIANRSDFETHGVLMSEPASKLRLKFLDEGRTHVEVGDAGAAAEPLQNSPAGKIGVESLHVYRHCSQRLVGIQHHVGTDLVSFFDDRLGILNEGAAENYVRDRNQKGLLVDGV